MVNMNTHERGKLKQHLEMNVRKGYVSVEAAKKDYGVIINADTGLADGAATQKKRLALRG
jgi:N-methylhydantoinase B/oxoprolinase/acetone carboxylase alpha subunit